MRSPVLYMSLMTVLICGCSQIQSMTGPQKFADLKIDAAPSPLVEFQPTQVVKKDEGVEIAGAVTRKADAPQQVKGHVHVQVINPKGEVLEEIPASVTPSPVTGD